MHHDRTFVQALVLPQNYSRSEADLWIVHRSANLELLLEIVAVPRLGFVSSASLRGDESVLFWNRLQFNSYAWNKITIYHCE